MSVEARAAIAQAIYHLQRADDREQRFAELLHDHLEITEIVTVLQSWLSDSGVSDTFARTLSVEACERIIDIMLEVHRLPPITIEELTKRRAAALRAVRLEMRNGMKFSELQDLVGSYHLPSEKRLGQAFRKMHRVPLEIVERRVGK